MAKKAGLGRGLDALFADAAPINEEEYSSGTEEQITEKAESAKSAISTKPVKAKDKISEKKSKADKAAVSEETSVETDKTNEKKEAAYDEEDVIIYANINDIKPNAAQPRKRFDEDKIRELAESIKANGVIQPLIVRPAENGYELVAGERRWRASRIAGLKKVPCIIRHFDDRQNAIVAIIENMQRENLDPIEEAEGLKSMTEQFGFTQEQISASLGKSRTYITNSIRLLKLPEEIREYVSNGQMSAAHGRTIINIADVKKQREICEKVIREGLSVRATERLADKAKDEIKPDRKKRASKAKKSNDILAAEAELRTLTGTKVNISGDGKNGKLEFDYYSTEELNRLIDTVKDAFK